MKRLELADCIKCGDETPPHLKYHQKEVQNYGEMPSFIDQHMEATCYKCGYRRIVTALDDD